MPSRPTALSPAPFDAVTDPARYVSSVCDFVAGDLAGTLDDSHAGLGEWDLVIVDVAGAADSDIDVISTAATVQDHPGVVSLNTGPTTPAGADEAWLGMQNLDAFIIPDGTSEPILVETLVQFPSVTSVEFNFGLFDANNAAGRGQNSVSVEYDASADAEFNLVVVDGGTATAVATTIAPVIDTWYRLQLSIHEDEVQLYIDGDFAARTTSANIPDDEGLGIGWKVATETTAEKSVLIDYGKYAVKADRRP